MLTHRMLGRVSASAAAVAVMAAGLTTPAHAAGPTINAPEVLVGTIARDGGSLTGSDPFSNAAFKVVAGPSSLAPSSFATSWTYTNSDPASNANRLILSAIGHYECTSATFSQNSCVYIEKTRATYSDAYLTSQVFFTTFSNLTVGKYVFPILTLLMKSGTPYESRSATGYFVMPSNPSVNPPTTSLGDQSAKTISMDQINAKKAANERWGVDFQQWSGGGGQTPSRTIRIFDCPQAFDTTTPPNQPTGCTTVSQIAVGTSLVGQGVPINTYAWNAGRYLVATDTLALASPGLLTAHMRASSYQITASTTQGVPADPNDPANPGGNAGANAGANAGGNAGANAGANAGGNANTGVAVDPGAAALIGVNPELAPLVSENGVGTRSEVTMTLQVPSKAARGVKKVYRAILSPATQAGRVVFTIARAKSDGTMKVLKKASAVIKKGKAAKAIVIPRSAAKGTVRVYASYLPKPSSAAGMTISKAMTLR